MLTIDGSYNEGGGQILRTALTLSLATRTPFRIDKIRAGRKRPGLLRQHLAAVKAATQVGNAEVVGDEINSESLTFAPRDVIAGDYHFSIGTAGSTLGGAAAGALAGTALGVPVVGTVIGALSGAAIGATRKRTTRKVKSAAAAKKKTSTTRGSTKTKTKTATARKATKKTAAKKPTRKAQATSTARRSATKGRRRSPRSSR